MTIPNWNYSLCDSVVQVRTRVFITAGMTFHVTFLMPTNYQAFITIKKPSLKNPSSTTVNITCVGMRWKCNSGMYSPLRVSPQSNICLDYYDQWWTFVYCTRSYIRKCTPPWFSGNSVRKCQRRIICDEHTYVLFGDGPKITWFCVFLLSFCFEK